MLTAIFYRVKKIKDNLFILCILIKKRNNAPSSNGRISHFDCESTGSNPVGVVCERGVKANIRAFQACDAGSIPVARFSKSKCRDKRCAAS